MRDLVKMEEFVVWLPATAFALVVMVAILVNFQLVKDGTLNKIGDWICQNYNCDCNDNGYCNFSTGACVCEQGFNPPNCTASFFH